MAPTKRLSSTARLRVALLTNSLSPHTLPLCEGISAEVGVFRAFVSAAVDTFHGFPNPRASFPIVVQRSFNGIRLRHRTREVSVSEQLHLPLDTLQQLFRYRPDVVLSSQLGGANPVCNPLPPPSAEDPTHSVGRAFQPHRTRAQQLSPSTAPVGGAPRRCSFRERQQRGEYLRSLGFTGSISTIPYTIDDSLFRTHTYQPEQHERRLLYCGRIDATKGTLRFYLALRRWCSDHPGRRVHFEMIGGGPDSEAILAHPPPVNLKLSLLPRLDQADLAAHYHRADIFVFPSLFDEWGVVINEAMSAGLPVLGSIYSQAVVELVNEGNNGWLFAPDDEPDTYASLDRALSANPGQLQGMSSHARAAVQEISPGRITARAVAAIAAVYGLHPEPAASSRFQDPHTTPEAIPVA